MQLAEMLRTLFADFGVPGATVNQAEKQENEAAGDFSAELAAGPSRSGTDPRRGHRARRYATHLWSKQDGFTLAGPRVT